MKDFIAIVQARMSSKRFPGKVLHPVKGKPVLEYLVESLSQVLSKDEFVIATSDDSSDDPIYDYCKLSALKVVRGSLEDVSLRFKQVLDVFPARCFARICADSPLFDYRILKAALDIKDQDFDLISTSVTQRYPSGMNLELLLTDTYLNSLSAFESDRHKEHCTSYFYENAEKFKLIQLPNPLSEVEQFKFAFDTQEDLERIDKLLAAMDKPHYEYSLAELYELALLAKV